MGDRSTHVVFSTGCSEFQDWQSVGIFSSADAVGQRGVITRIASGCKPNQEASIRHAMAHLPRRCRVFFAPDTTVKDHAGRYYKYANKPLGMMKWLQAGSVPPSATVALIDPDFFFLRPLWRGAASVDSSRRRRACIDLHGASVPHYVRSMVHRSISRHDSFDAADATFASGPAKKTPMPAPLRPKTMIAQRYGIGGKPWTSAAGRNGQLAWGLRDFFTSIGRPDSPASAPDLNERTADAFYSIGAPYVALAQDWLPIATNWTGLMPMAVQRNFGNLAEMYAMVIAVADLGIRPATVDSLMVSNVGAGGEGWPFVDKLPPARACDPTLLDDETYRLPFFLHYCQRYEHTEPPPYDESNWIYSKYQVPDEILQCPAGTHDVEGAKPKKKAARQRMRLDAAGFLPEPKATVDAAALTGTSGRARLRHVWAFCAATRRTNLAARDYRRWFCEKN